MGTTYHRIVKIESVTEHDGTIVVDQHTCSCGHKGDAEDIVKHINEEND